MVCGELTEGKFSNFGSAVTWDTMQMKMGSEMTGFLSGLRLWQPALYYGRIRPSAGVFTAFDNSGHE